MKGFREKMAADYGGAIRAPLRRLTAIARLNRIRAGSPDALKPGGILGRLRYAKQRYDRTKRSPVFRAKQVVGAGLLGGAGLAVGLDRIQQTVDPARVDAPRQPLYAEGGMG